MTFITFLFQRDKENRFHVSTHDLASITTSVCPVTKFMLRQVNDTLVNKATRVDHCIIMVQISAGDASTKNRSKFTFWVNGISKESMGGKEHFQNSSS